ncbi:unnamed protein product [Paramecium octaurelia]|uniref:Uncharacterized protein n=1 Tax=Paramecium octaurelia TaxID=43137 RepID=A0A8S1XKN4_PAROT|nr:unnamed protein product [Paramecium octaurelia]
MIRIVGKNQLKLGSDILNKSGIMKQNKSFYYSQQILHKINIFYRLN